MDLMTQIATRAREWMRPRCAHCGTTEDVTGGYCSDACWLDSHADALM